MDTGLIILFVVLGILVCGVAAYGVIVFLNIRKASVVKKTEQELINENRIKSMLDYGGLIKSLLAEADDKPAKEKAPEVKPVASPAPKTETTPPPAKGKAAVESKPAKSEPTVAKKAPPKK